MTLEDFERLYEQHAPSLFAFLAYRCGDRTTAEDLLADTFERALRVRLRFDRRRASEKTWLYSIAVNLARDEQRRRGAQERALERLGADVDRADGESPLRAVEAKQTLGPALAVLAADEREAIALRFGADLTVPEIARVTRQKLTTVEGRVYRALRKLRQQLADAPEETSVTVAPPPPNPEAGLRRAGLRSASR